MAQGQLPHLLLVTPPTTSFYTTTNLGRGNIKNPARIRDTHGNYLKDKLRQAWSQATQEEAVSHATRKGVYLEFKSDPGADLVIKSLESRVQNIRLLNVRKISEVAENAAGAPILEPQQTSTYATVFVPHTQKEFFVRKLETYINEDTPKGKPKNAALVESIGDIRKALLVGSFWSDLSTTPPKDNHEWIEVWLSSHNRDVIKSFEALLTEQKIPSRSGHIRFPERAVKMVYVNGLQLEALTTLSDHIAEYRKADTTANYWMELKSKDQADWVNNLLDRCTVDTTSLSSICILDTGVNSGHPLLQPLLSDEDCQAFDPEWGTNDHDKHGTLMAGIAAYGDLAESLESNEVIELTHRLESVKILPRPPEQNSPNLWGYITSQAISKAEIQAPSRNRSFCMAVTANNTEHRGRPSSWSAQLDQSSSGAEDEEYRLIIVSAGNISTDIIDAANNYPDIQLTDSVHDPAQSWNTIAVGAYTELDQITDATLSKYTPVAPKHGLSPFSTTSLTWEENTWPVKPELVLEGGNLASDGSGFATECDDLSLLSTHYDQTQAHFSTFNMTSAATAKLSWMAGKLQASNPDYWPETIRALLIHSAEWPETLKQQFMADDTKTSFKRLLSICGYGVPSLERAMFSSQNSLTLVAQSELQPFDKKPKPSSGFRTRDMHFYDLPWPKDTLLNLPDETPVEMRVTLSYFVEPGPGEIGWQDRYRYASHGLRFELNSPGEEQAAFLKRINKAARDEDEDKPGTKAPNDHWLLGSQARNRGSVHSDIWQGTAADLADSNLIAVSPTIGWWRERSYLGRWNKKARYSLIVSITTPDESVDVYTPVAAQIQLPVAIEIEA